MCADHYSTEAAVKIEPTNATGHAFIAINLFIALFSNRLQWHLVLLSAFIKDLRIERKKASPSTA